MASPPGTFAFTSRELGEAGEAVETVEEAFDRAFRFPLRDNSGARGQDATSTSTSIALVCDRERLHFLFEMACEPPLLVRTAEDRVPPFLDECVELFLATPDDATRYHEIVVNPRGVLYTAFVVNPDDSRATWRVTPGVPIEGLQIAPRGEPEAARPSEWERWSCRISLPRRTLESPDGALRGNLFRIGRGRSTRFEALSPTFRTDPPDFHVPSRFARLVLPERERPRC